MSTQLLASNLQKKLLPGEVKVLPNRRNRVELQLQGMVNQGFAASWESRWHFLPTVDETAGTTSSSLVVIIKGDLLARFKETFADVRRTSQQTGDFAIGWASGAQQYLPSDHRLPLSRRISHHLTRRRIRTCKKGNAWGLTHYRLKIY